MMPFRVFSLLSLGLLGVSGASTNGKSTSLETDTSYKITADCPYGDGIYAHAEYCNAYYDCMDGERIKMECDEGLVYDPKLAATQSNPCNYNFDVKCDLKNAPKAPKSIEAKDGCPVRNGKFGLKSDCNRFIVCANGIKYTRSCPAGLVYEAEKGNCVYGYQASSAKCRKEYTFPCDKQHIPINSYKLMPHPNDCRFYFICAQEYPDGIMLGCPAGQLYDQKKEQCRRIRKVEDRAQCKNYYIKVKKTDIPSEDRAEFEVAGYHSDPYFKNYVYIPRKSLETHPWLAKFDTNQ